MSAVGSTIGPHREDNEDRAAVAVIRYPHDRKPSLRIAIVCDGMGGLVEGGRAASEAIATFIASFLEADRSFRASLTRAVRLADRAVFELLHGRGGTTLTAVVSDGVQAWCAHVGDSRLYSAGPTGLALLTQDDTIKGAIHAHEGGGSEDELDNRLLQFVGIGNQIAPHVFPVPMENEHFWILTSDGAHGIGRKSLESLFENTKSASELVRKTIFVADALNVRDNASIAVMRQHDPLYDETTLGGTSISVSSPVKMLELWFVKTRQVPVQDSPVAQGLDTDTNDAASDASDYLELAEAAAQPKAKPKKKGKSKRSSRPPQERMEVLFESKKADDRSS